MNIYIDIETGYPSRDEVTNYVYENAPIDRRLTDPKKIEQHRADQLKLTPLNPLWGEVYVIGLAVDSGAPFAIYQEDTVGEPEMLRQFVDDLMAIRKSHDHRQIKWIGYNVRFDLKFLWTRLLLHRIPHEIDFREDAKPWDNNPLDIRQVLSWGDRYAKGTLKDWSFAFGSQETSVDIDGSEVPERIAASQLSPVIEHCLFDVERVQVIHRALRDAKVV